MDWRMSDVIISVAIILVLFFFYVLVLPILPSDVNFHLVVTVITYIAAIGYLYKKYHHGLFCKPEKIWPVIVAIIFLSILYIPYINWLNNNNVPKQFTVLSKINDISKIIYILIYCTIIPIEEEILFRGLYFRIIKNKYNISIATAVSVGLFTLNHAFQGIDLVSITVQGLIYTYVYEKSKSIYSSIFIHVIDNSVWFLVTYLYLRT